MIEIIIEPVNLVFFTIMIIIFSISLSLHFFSNNDNNFRKIFSVSKVKNYLTILWMLWTFIGIIIWLWEFNTENISLSIPTLLEWLKTAF